MRLSPFFAGEALLLLGKRVPLDVALDVLLAFEEEPDLLEEGGRGRGRRLPEQDLHGIREIDAHNALPASRVGATSAVGAIGQTV